MKTSRTIPWFLTILLAMLGTALAADKPKGPKKGGLHANPADARELKIGDAAPDFSLPGIDGRKHSLADYREGKILIVAFISNHCPDSHAAQGRLEKLIADVKGQGVTLVAINPNNPEGLSIDELGYSKYSDSFDDMKKYAADTKITFPYLYDGETQAVAKEYGCLATPHLFIFDAERKLRYKGRFDDSHFADPATVKSPDAGNAVRALLAGTPVPVSVTQPHGCSTKWLEKKPLVAARVEKWNRTPVEVEPIDAAGIAKLRQNGTNKLRLFNVWATWCGSCRAEFPELVTTSRKFGMRDFELITLSVDDPKDMAKAKEFLEKQGAGLLDGLKPSLKKEGRKTNSYLFTGADTGELMKALDPDSPGAVPHTVLVDPKGNVVWRHNGPVDGEELRAKVLEYLGEYYKR